MFYFELAANSFQIFTKLNLQPERTQSKQFPPTKEIVQVFLEGLVHHIKWKGLLFVL